MASGVSPPGRRDCMAKKEKRKKKIKDVKWPATMRAVCSLDNGDADGEQEKRLGRYGQKRPNNPQHTPPGLICPNTLSCRRSDHAPRLLLLSLWLCTIPFFPRTASCLHLASLCTEIKERYLCRFHRVCNVFCSVPFANHQKYTYAYNTSIYSQRPYHSSSLFTDRSSSHRGLLINC